MSFVPLGDLCEVLDYRRKPVTKRDRVSGQFPYYGATGIVDYVADYIFDEKLVLIGEDGAKWGAGERTAFAAGGKYWVNNHAHIIRPHRDKVLDEWIIHYLNFSDLSRFITGLTVPKLNQEKLCEIPIPLLSLSEQKRILDILEKVFGGLATATANADKNVTNVSELFNNYLNSIFEQKGEGWVEVPFEDALDEVKYTTKIKRRDFLSEGKFPIISQEADFINGYWSQSKDVFKVTTPVWPAPGSEDTELGVLMGPEGGHGETEVYARVQA